MTLRAAVVTDTETTGMSETDQVVEVAVVLVDGSERRPVPRGAWTTLVRPSCPVSIPARANHHISDDVLAEAEPMSSHVKKLEWWFADPAHAFAAHNAEFDRRMLTQSGVSGLPEQSICTVKCAQHLWPDAPGYSNQVLRYWLGIDVKPWRGMPPHRAMPDAQVTAEILIRMLGEKDVTLDRLVELTATPVLLRTCHMGQWSGKPWSEVDAGFLEWLIAKGPRRPDPKGGRDIGFEPDVLHTARHWLERKRGVRS